MRVLGREGMHEKRARISKPRGAGSKPESRRTGKLDGGQREGRHPRTSALCRRALGPCMPPVVVGGAEGTAERLEQVRVERGTAYLSAPALRNKISQRSHQKNPNSPNVHSHPTSYLLYIPPPANTPTLLTRYSQAHSHPNPTLNPKGEWGKAEAASGAQGCRRKRVRDGARTYYS